MQEEEENRYRAGVAAGTIHAGLGPFGLAQKAKFSTEAAVANARRPRPSKADEDGLKLCQFCERKKALERFPMRLIMTCRGQAERKLGAHCKKCMIRSAHLRSNGYMRPHAQDLIKCYHQVRRSNREASRPVHCKHCHHQLCLAGSRHPIIWAAKLILRDLMCRPKSTARVSLATRAAARSMRSMTMARQSCR